MNELTALQNKFDEEKVTSDYFFTELLTFGPATSPAGNTEDLFVFCIPEGEFLELYLTATFIGPAVIERTFVSSIELHDNSGKLAESLSFFPDPDEQQAEMI